MTVLSQELCTEGAPKNFVEGSDDRGAMDVWHAEQLGQFDQAPLGIIGAYNFVQDLKQAKDTLSYYKLDLSAAPLTNGNTYWIKLPLNLYFDQDSHHKWVMGKEVSALQMRSSENGAEWDLRITRADEKNQFRYGWKTDAETEMNSTTSGAFDIKTMDEKTGEPLDFPESDEQTLRMKFVIDTSGNTSTAQLYSGRNPVGKPTTHTSPIGAGGIDEIWIGSCVAGSGVETGYIQFGDFVLADEELFATYTRPGDYEIATITESAWLEYGGGKLVALTLWDDGNSGTVEAFDVDKWEFRNEEGRHMMRIDTHQKVNIIDPVFRDGCLVVITGTAKVTATWKSAGDNDPADLVSLSDDTSDVDPMTL